MSEMQLIMDFVDDKLSFIDEMEFCDKIVNDIEFRDSLKTYLQVQNALSKLKSKMELPPDAFENFMKAINLKVEIKKESTPYNDVKLFLKNIFNRPKTKKI